jgi:hypothetical protein
MTLAAAQVVDAIAARLIGTAAGGVFTDRAWPIDAGALPAWKVYATQEDVSPGSIGDLEEHQLVVECRGIVAAVTGLDDAMNALAAAGLAAIHASGFANFVALTDGIRRAMAQEAGADVAVVTVLIAAQFYVHASTPEAFA